MRGTGMNMTIAIAAISGGAAVEATGLSQKHKRRRSDARRQQRPK